MTIKDVYNVTGQYLAYDEDKDTHVLVTIKIPCAKITYKDDGIPVVDVIHSEKGMPIYYIAVNEEE